MPMNSRKATDLRPESTPSIPWSEWSDAELNVEKWDVPKNGGDGGFLDSQPRAMPPSLEPHDWKRASAVKNLSGNPVLFIPRNGYPDFLRNNKHILHSEFVRWFISTLINLQYAGRDGLSVEESPNFTWLGESEPWQGWTHIYSLNKGGKSASQQQQQPAVNPNGKYLVRLFFMGFWRRFVVDDMIPVDVYGVPLLPRTENDFEIWPMLLAKAMIKLAALTWTDRREIRDFYPVSCLTGWVCLPQLTKSFSSNEKWELLTKYLKREETTLERKNKVLICANIVDTNDLTDDDGVPGFTPCWGHFVYFDEARGASENDKQILPPQVRWKLYRWVKWAVRHGLVDGEADYPMSGIRSLKLVSSFKKAGGCGGEEDREEAVQEEPTKLTDVEVWVDFEKLAPYVEEILMFYKPSDFEYHARISDALSTTAEPGPRNVSAGGGVRSGKAQPAGGRESKKATPATSSNVVGVPAFVSSLKWQRIVPNRRNDPLYMLIDSIETKFVLIDFSRMPRPRPAPLNGTERRSPGSCVSSYLLVERHNFFDRSTNDDDVALIKTLSSGSTIIEAGPGRHLYRILFRDENSYFIRIISDTIFHLGDVLRMQDLMSSESERVDAIAKGIGNAVSSAFQEFGKPGYADELRALRRSYMPRDEDGLNSGVDKSYVKTIHRIFIEELAKLVRATLPTAGDGSAACQALRVFFLDPTIGVNSEGQKEEPNKSSGYSGSSSAPRVGVERAAVIVQSFLRMALIKIYKKTHLPSHIRHNEVASGLRKVVELFEFTRRDSIAHLLIRGIISRVSSSGYQSLYPCHEDLDYVLNVEEWQGVVRNVQPSQWVPVTRVVLMVPPKGGKVHASINLVTGLPRQMLRVVNNETLREVPRIVNTPATFHFVHVECGYTVIGYGWSDAQKFKELPWLLHIATIRGQPRFLSQNSTVPTLALEELVDCYVPNVSNIVGKCFVKVFADSLLTFRLSTSYSGVETVLKILDGDENVLCEKSGGSAIVLPVVRLPFFGNTESVGSKTRLEGGETARGRKRSKSLTLDSGNKDAEHAANEYYVRIYVANDSWPLTPAEWSTVMETKCRGTVYDPQQGRTSTSSISRRVTRSRIRRGSQDHIGDGDARPSWRLQVLADAGTKIQLGLDRRREMELAEMKKAWEEAEAGRLQRGRGVRETFLEEGWPAWKRSSTANSGSETRDYEESISVPSRTSEIRTLKPPSYLARDFPPWNVIARGFKEDEEDAEEESWVKTEADEEMLRNQRAINVFDFDQKQATFVIEAEETLRKQRRRYSEFFSSFMKKEIEWKSRLEAAYELRSAYIAEVKAATSAQRENKNGKETATGKKKEKEETKKTKNKKTAAKGK